MLTAVRPLFLLWVGVILFGVGYAQDGVTKSRGSIGRLAHRLDKGTTLHLGEPVGIAGEPENNKYVRRYHKLSRKATNEELLMLTRHRSGLIKIYAFSILANRGHRDLRNIYLRNQKDDRSFYLLSGCLGTFIQVNEYMKSRLSSTLGGRIGPFLFNSLNHD